MLKLLKTFTEEQLEIIIRESGYGLDKDSTENSIKILGTSYNIEHGDEIFYEILMYDEPNDGCWVRGQVYVSYRDGKFSAEW